MKLVFVILSTLLCLSNNAQSQDSLKNIKVYNTWLKTFDKDYTIFCHLYSVQDSSIYVVHELNNSPIKIDIFNQVKYIEVQRKNSVVRGVVTGIVVGFVSGFTIGYGGGNQFFDPTELGVFLGTRMSFIGGAIGGIAGAIKIGIPINGNIETYNKNKKRLSKYAIVR